MTHTEFEALPPAVAEWIERLCIAGELPPRVEWALRNGTTEHVITLHTEAHETAAKRRLQAADMDNFYGGKI